jgi:hypothetical protein
MNAKFHKSILNMGKARQLLEQLPASWGVGTADSANGVTLFARRCARRAYGKTELTGGIVITATGPRPDFLGRAPTVSRRLKPNWTDTQFVMAAARCFQEVLNVIRLNFYRDALYHRFGDDITSKLEVAVRRAKKATGHTDVYSDMTSDDVRFWNEWLNKRQAKGEKIIPTFI